VRTKTRQLTRPVRQKWTPFIGLRERGQFDIPHRSVAPRLLNTALRAYNVCDWLCERVAFGTFVVACGRTPHPDL
jgi:hypothetical protein